MSSVLLESRPFRPFKSSEEYLYAMKEDLAEWLQTMYPHLNINVENFMEKLETGVALCVHANAVKAQAVEYVERKQAKKLMTRSVTGSLAQAQQIINIPDVKYFNTAKPGTFFSRDNVSNFIKWCRTCLQILECLLFETDDLIERKNEKHVILCLLEVARYGAKFGMLAPMLVQMERQIDREIAADNRKLAFNIDENNSEENQQEEESDSDIEDENPPVLMYGPVPQIVTNDLKSLDEMVRDLVEKCTCPTQFPMIRVSEGKYRIGDTKVLIFVRILRNHVMVRVGGGWDTLAHYLDKHDPCRCRSQHRSTQSARLVNKPGAMDLQGANVYYERSPMPGFPPNSKEAALAAQNSHSLGPPMNSLNRSRSRSPSQKTSYLNDSRRSVSPNLPRKGLAPPSHRSRSPTPNFTSTHMAKLSSNNVRKSGPQSLPYIPTSPKAKHVTTMQIPVENKVLKTEATLHVNDSDHSDTTSEMSDEGYRSLGLVQDKNRHRSSMYSQNSVEDVDETTENQLTEDDLNDFGLRKTHFSEKMYENSDKSKPTIDSPKKSIPTRKENSFVQTKKNNPAAKKENSFVHTSPKRPPPSAAVYSKSKMMTNTWNGRQKQARPSLGNLQSFTTDSVRSSPSNFARNSTGRRSVSYDRRSSSAATSPTKTLKDELLNVVKKAHNDEAIAIQLQEILKRYGSLNILNGDGDSGPESLPASFGRHSGERMSYRSPRKDSRPENNFSKIPAPVMQK